MTGSEQYRIAVLGAGGFLGSTMARYLSDAGYHVTLYCRQPTTALDDRANVRSITADLRDTWRLADALTDIDVIYHFASATHPSLFFANPAAEYHEAVQPLLVVMETAAKAGVKKIVFPSSGGTVYADSDRARSEDSATDPRSPYAIFKLASEQLLHHAARLGKFAVDVYRIGNPYGPGQRPRPGQGVLAHWIEAVQQRHPIKIFGDGTAERDYVYVQDVCQLMAFSCQQIDHSDTYNLGTGIGTSLNELAGLLQASVGPDQQVVHVPGRPSDIASIVLASDKLLSRVPGFQFTPLADGIAATLLAQQINRPLSQRPADGSG